MLLSGRTTYSDWILGLLPDKSGYKDGKAGFYDIGATLSHTFNVRNKLNITAAIVLLSTRMKSMDTAT